LAQSPRHQAFSLYLQFSTLGLFDPAIDQEKPFFRSLQLKYPAVQKDSDYCPDQV